MRSKVRSVKGCVTRVSVVRVAHRTGVEEWCVGLVYRRETEESHLKIATSGTVVRSTRRLPLDLHHQTDHPNNCVPTQKELVRTGSEVGTGTGFRVMDEVLLNPPPSRGDGPSFTEG